MRGARSCCGSWGAVACTPCRWTGQRAPLQPEAGWARPGRTAVLSLEMSLPATMTLRQGRGTEGGRQVGGQAGEGGETGGRAAHACQQPRQVPEQAQTRGAPRTGSRASAAQCCGSCGRGTGGGAASSVVSRGKGGHGIKSSASRCARPPRPRMHGLPTAAHSLGQGALGRELVGDRVKDGRLVCRAEAQRLGGRVSHAAAALLWQGGQHSAGLKHGRFPRHKAPPAALCTPAPPPGHSQTKLLVPVKPHLAVQS